MDIIGNGTLLQEVEKGVEALPDALLDKLGSLKKDVRNKAFLLIEKQFQNNQNMLASAPMGFLKKQDVDAAISFIIATLEHKRTVSFDVVQEVYDTIISELEIAGVQDNKESTELIEHKLQLLIALLEDEKYMQDEKILKFLYDEKMRTQSYIQGLQIAQKLIEKDYPEGYILLGLAYKCSEEPQLAIDAFLDGWNHFQTQIHIENIVISAYELGNLELCEKWYSLGVQLFPQSMGYFIEYSLTITSWEEFEILTQNILPHTFSDMTKKLLESAITFLQVELQEEQENFSKSKEIDVKKALSSFFESLKIAHYLLEYSQDVQVLLYHIFQFQEGMKTQDETLKEIIRQFLESYYPLDVRQMLENDNESESDQPEGTNEVSSKDSPQNHIKVSLEEHLYLYILNCVRTFVSCENQGALISGVFPFLKELGTQVQEYQQIIMDVEYISYMQQYMFREGDFLASLSVDMREVYASLVANIDEKYGKTARRNIEFFAKNSKPVEEFKNVELISFQMIRTCINDSLISGLSSEKVEEMLEKYNIFSIAMDKDILLLLGEILFKNGCKKQALAIFTHTHIQYQDDMSLYFVLKTSYMMGQKESAESYKKLLLSFDFEGNISQYVQAFIQDMKSFEDLDSLNQKYLLLLEGISKVLFPEAEEDIKNIMDTFHAVGQMKDPEGTWWLGKIYEAHSELTSALGCYYEAFFAQEIKNPIYLKECFKIGLHMKNQIVIVQLVEDSGKYFSYRGFEGEYFGYQFEYTDISHALLYFINTTLNNAFSTSFPNDMDVKIQFLASKKDSISEKEFRQTLLAQIVSMIKTDFSISSQIAFLQTLSTLPEEFLVPLAGEMFELISHKKVDISSSAMLLVALENFAQAIIQKEINEAMLPLLRDFYYFVAKIFQKIPGGEEYARYYIKKMDIPYVSGNFTVLPQELSSALYH